MRKFWCGDVTSFRVVTACKDHESNYRSDSHWPEVMIFAFCLMLVFFISAAPSQASAVTSGNYTYTVIDETAKTAQLHRIDNASGVVNIPSEIDGYTITKLENSAIYGNIFVSSSSTHNQTVTSITIPGSVSNIGDHAFDRCDILADIIIPPSVASIGRGVFAYCTGLTNFSIGSGVASVGDMAFNGCTKLESINIPDGVISNIGLGAFQGCTALSSVTIPNSVTSIGESAFYNCLSLTDVVWGSGVNSINNMMFYSCTGLENITMPDNVTSIGENSFCQCMSLASITIPDNVVSIGEKAFFNCHSLPDITIPASVTSIGPEAFTCCFGVLSFNVDDGNTNYTSIDGALFNSSATTLVAYPGGKIDSAYQIPASVTTIDEGAFAYCSNLATVNIPDSVTSIGDDAFWASSSLNSINIPDSVESIGDWSFWYCSGLTSAYFYGNVPNSFGDGVFDDTAPGFTLYYIDGQSGWTNPTWTSSAGDLYNTATFIPAPILQSIAITKPASKLAYTVGETLDISGLEVTGTYNDDSTAILTITLDNISGFDSSTPIASQTLTVTVDGKTATYDISIAAAPQGKLIDVNSSWCYVSADDTNQTTGDVTITANAGYDAIAGHYTATVIITLPEGVTFFDNQTNIKTFTGIGLSESTPLFLYGDTDLRVDVSADNIGSIYVDVRVYVSNGPEYILDVTETQVIAKVAAISNDASLSGLVPSNGGLDPAFDPGVLDYALNVENNVSSITLTPSLNDSNASVTVNGVAVASGNASEPIDLVAGIPQAIPVVVTAQDGVTTQTYTVTATRSVIPSGYVGVTSSYTWVDADVNQTAGEIHIIEGDDYSSIAGEIDKVYVQITLPEGVLCSSYENSAGTKEISNGNEILISNTNPNVVLSNIVLDINPEVSGAITTDVRVYGKNSSGEYIFDRTVTKFIAKVNNYVLSITAASAESVAADLDQRGANLTIREISPNVFGDSNEVTITILTAGVTWNTAAAGLENLAATFCTADSVVVDTDKILHFNVIDDPAQISRVIFTPIFDVSPATTGDIVVRVSGTNIETADYTLAQIAASADLILSDNSIEMNTYDEVIIRAYLPAGVTGDDIMGMDWETDDSDVAVISDYDVSNPDYIEFILESYDEGSCTITISVTTTAGDFQGSCAVTVTDGATGGGYVDVNSDWTYVSADDTNQTTGDVTVTANAGYDALAGPYTATVIITLPEGVTFFDNQTNIKTFTGIGLSESTPLFLSGDTDLRVDVSADNIGSIYVDVRVYVSNGPEYIFDETESQVIAKVAAISDDASLSGLVPSNGSLDPAFESVVYDYALNVENSVSSITLTPIVNDSNAAVTVNGLAVVSGAASEPIDLVAGIPQPIPVMVTAQDGVTTRTYTVIATRAENVIPSGYVGVTNSWTWVDADVNQTAGEIHITEGVDYSSIAGEIDKVYLQITMPDGVLCSSYVPSAGTEERFSGNEILISNPDPNVDLSNIVLDIDPDITGSILVNVRVYAKNSSDQFIFDQTVLKTIAKVNSTVLSISAATPRSILPDLAQRGANLTIRETSPNVFSNPTEVTITILTAGVTWDIDDSGSENFAATFCTVDDVMVDTDKVLNFTVIDDPAQISRVTFTPGFDVHPDTTGDIVVQVSGTNIETADYTVAQVAVITDLILNDYSINMNTDDEAIIRAYLPNGVTTADIMDISWETDDEDIAEITDYDDSNLGYVKFILNSYNEGSCTITISVTTTAGDFQAACVVTVTDGATGGGYVDVNSDWTYVSADETDQTVGDVTITANPGYDAIAGSYTANVNVTLPAGVTFTDNGSDTITFADVDLSESTPFEIYGEPDLVIDVGAYVSGDITADVRVYVFNGAEYLLDETESQIIARVAASINDASLSGLSPSNGGLDPVFDPGVLEYVLNVENSVSSIALTPIVNDSNAAVTVNGAAVVNGNASEPIDLVAGIPQPIPVVVTAQDGVTTRTYTVTATRAENVIPSGYVGVTSSWTWVDADVNQTAGVIHISEGVDYSSIAGEIDQVYLQITLPAGVLCSSYDNSAGTKEISNGNEILISNTDPNLEISNVALDIDPDIVGVITTDIRVYGKNSSGEYIFDRTVTKMIAKVNNYVLSITVASPELVAADLEQKGANLTIREISPNVFGDSNEATVTILTAGVTWNTTAAGLENLAATNCTVDNVTVDTDKVLHFSVIDDPAQISRVIFTPVFDVSPDTTGDIVVRVSGTNIATADYTLAQIAESVTVTPESPNVNVDETPLQITVPADVNNASLITSPVDGVVTIPQVSVQASTDQGNIDVSIADGTEVTGPTDWDGTINLPQVVDPGSVTVTPENGYEASVSGAIELGITDSGLAFSQPVRIMLAGQGGKKAGWILNETFTPITYEMPSDTAEALEANPDGYLTVGSDLVIWTTHFTTFVAYAETPLTGYTLSGQVLVEGDDLSEGQLHYSGGVSIELKQGEEIKYSTTSSDAEDLIGNGSFSITGIAAGDYTVVISKAGYLTRSLALTINSDLTLATTSDLYHNRIYLWAGDIVSDEFNVIAAADVNYILSKFNSDSTQVGFDPQVDIVKDQYNVISAMDVNLMLSNFNKNSTQYPADITY